MIGLQYIAKKNGAASVDDYVNALKANLETQGINGLQEDLYNEGNSRSRALATVHPRTRSAILYLLQLDQWIPDGSGSQPSPFDSSVADSRINNLGYVII